MNNEREWRQERFAHVVGAMQGLDRLSKKYEMSGIDDTLIEEEYETAKRTLALGIFHVYLDVVDAGEPVEIAEAHMVFDVLRDTTVAKEKVA